MAAKKKMGRPSKFAESLVKAKDYLMGGYETVGDVVPSVAGLACYLGISRSTAQQYAKENEDFSGTLEAIKTLQENRLINKGLIGDFNPTITKLMLANHGYSEKQEVDHTSSDNSMSPKPVVEVTSLTDEDLIRIVLDGKHENQGGRGATTKTKG